MEINQRSEKQKMIEEFLNNAGFRDRIIIGIYERDRIYFHIDLSDELANGLMTSAMIDESVYDGIRDLAATLETILERIEQYQPEDDKQIH
jgi:hypothetical protein